MASFNKFILFYTIVWLFAACKPDSDMPCRSVVEKIDGFTTAEQVVSQVQEFDSLWYVNASNDTILLTKTTEPTQYSKIALRGNPECPADSMLFPIVKMAFQNIQEAILWKLQVSKAQRNLIFQAAGDTAIFSFEELSNSDSIDIAQLNANGLTFQNIHIVLLGADSLYYTTSQGIVRFRNLTLIQWK